jgi:uncharacterized protein (DUF58 family)
MHAMVSRAEPEHGAKHATRLAELIDAALAALKRRSLVFVVSDFFSVPGWQKPLAVLARRHDVVAVRLYDPMEQQLPDLGLTMIEDAETGEQVFVDTHDRRFRKRFADIAARRERELRAALAVAGVDALELSTGDDLAEALLRFADLRRRRARSSTVRRLPDHLRVAR